MKGLPSSTDDIETRQGCVAIVHVASDEDTPVEIIELYVIVFWYIASVNRM